MNFTVEIVDGSKAVCINSQVFFIVSLDSNLTNEALIELAKESIKARPLNKYEKQQFNVKD